jgi:hypothetical protein
MIASQATTRSVQRGVLTVATITRRSLGRFQRTGSNCLRPAIFHSVKRVFLLALAVGTGLALATACGSGGHPKPYTGLNPDAGGSGGGGTGGNAGLDATLSDGPPAPDSPGLCGNLVVPVVADMPNLYFIVDRSGSMADPLPGNNYNKYVNARIAMGNVLRAIGHRVRYGAAAFPMPGGAILGCGPGKEIFPTTQGDPASYAAEGKQGPVLTSLLTQLANIAPEGGTPTSASIDNVAPILKALPGKTFVILETDGAPNCNPNAVCTADQCDLNLAGLVINGISCQAPTNCCDPQTIPDGQLDCVDGNASANAVAALYQAGILTYVVGMPGSELFAGVLDQMAVAGGTARPTSPKYYPVTDADVLTATLKEIGIKVAISCDVTLDQKPPDKSLVNVYLDSSLVQYDPIDGWSWTSDTSLTVNGASCAQLKSGDVLQLQVVAGCPTSVK